MMAAQEQWYTADKDDLPAKLEAYATAVRQRNQWWDSRLALYLRLYGGDRYFSGYTGARGKTGTSGAPRVRVAWDGGRPRLAVNVIAPIVDAAANRMCEGRPRPVFMTTRGDWGLHQTARDRTKLVEGIFQQGQFFEARQRAIKSAALCGTGWVAPVWNAGRIEYEYVFPGEIVIDDWEGQSHAPRSIVRERLMDRAQLQALYPAQKTKLEDSGSAGRQHYGYDSSIDQVVVREAWHLPSKEGATDGRFSRTVTNAVLQDGKLKRQRWPLTPWIWGDPFAGFLGEGIAERLLGIQREINSVLRTISANVYSGGNLKVAVERGAQIVDAQLSNALGGVRIDYTGAPPQFFVNDVFSPQLLQYLTFLIERAYNVARVSELSASSEVPAALTGSGKSMLVYQNIEAKGFVMVGRSDERSVLEATLRTLDLAEDMGDDFEVVYRSKSWLEKFRAKELLKNRDDFDIQMQPASWLPATVAGKVATAQELVASGWWGREQAMKEAEIPVDPDAELDLENAPMDLIDQRIELILKHGKALSPHPRMNLELYVKRANLAYQRAEINQAPVDRLDMLGKTIDMAISLQEKAAKELAAKLQAAQGGAPANGASAAPIPPQAA
jgi:hypothetical protein